MATLTEDFGQFPAKGATGPDAPVEEGAVEGAVELEAAEMMANATRATDFLKALAHEGRLMILCHLASGERSVTELERLLSQRQAAVSQQLARLRLEGLVESRREGKAIFYRLADGRARRMIEIIHEMFCARPG